jgi:hypothetical protein
MTLLSPWFLLGALAVGLPLWLHLLQRRNPVRLPFSSIMFFEKSTQSTFLQRQFRYLLLLALRVALLVLAALAFAKPIWERPPTTITSDVPALHLIVLDTSLSMNRAGRWERALDEARAVVDGLSERDQAQVLATGPSVRVVTNPTRDRVELRQAIDSLAPGSSRNSYGDVMEAVRSLAPDADTPIEVHLISDFQHSAMPGRFSDLTPPTAARLHARNVAGANDTNWAIESVKGSLRLAGADKPVLEAVVAGFAAEPARRTVTLEIDGKTVASQSQEVPAMGRASFRFEGFDAPPGYSRARLILSPNDDLPQDDVRLVALDNSSPEPILFVTNDRRRRDALYYDAALRSSRAAAFELKSVSPGEAERLRPDDFAMVVLSDIAQLSAGYTSKLEEYVKSGGAVLVAVGPEIAARGTVPLGGQRTAPAPMSDGRSEFQFAGRVDATYPALSRVEGLRGVKFFRHARLAPGPDDDVFAQLADGSPLLIERTLGAGRVATFASTFDNIWNDLPIRPVFVPFVAETARYLSGSNEETAMTLVDATIELGRRRDGAGMVQVFDPGGRRALSLAEAVARDEVTLDQVGFYELRGPAGVELIAVNPDPRESNLRPMEADTLELWQGAGRSGGGAPGEPETVAIKPPPIHLWRFLLFLFAAAVLIESVLANARLNVRREV